MNILITDRLSANHYIAVGWGNAFASLGHNVYLWNPEKIPAFDIFNKFNPDILLTSSWQLDRAQIKCIAQRPNLKVLVSLSNWGTTDKDLDEKTTHIASTQERSNVEALVKAAPHVKLGLCQYADRYVGETHNGWRDVGVETFGLPLGADITNFPLTYPSSAYRSDLCLVSGRWPEKAKELDKYLLSLTYPNTTLDIKIFGNGWGSIPQAFGYIPDELIRHYYASAVVCPNIHEPQALKSGVDINQRAYQVISAGGFQISQRVRSMEEDFFFNNEVVFVDSPKEFMDQVLYFREHPDQRLPYIKRGLDTVYDNHTFLHRVADMFNKLDEGGERDKALGFADSIYYQMKQEFEQMYGESL